MQAVPCTCSARCGSASGWHASLPWQTPLRRAALLVLVLRLPSHSQSRTPPPPSPCPQSYRAAMAVLRQQRAFIADLYERGAVDEDDREALLTAVDAAMRQLDVTGALCLL